MLPTVYLKPFKSRFDDHPESDPVIGGIVANVETFHFRRRGPERALLGKRGLLHT